MNEVKAPSLWARTITFLTEHVLIPWIAAAFFVLAPRPAALAIGIRTLTTTYSVPVWALFMLGGGWVLFVWAVLGALGTRRSSLVIVPASTAPGIGRQAPAAEWRFFKLHRDEQGS